HASTAHLASNVITLAAVGLSFEQAHGAPWLLALLLVGGAIANGAEYPADPSVEGLIMGASGGVLAVFGGLCRRYAPTTLSMVLIGLALLWPLLPWATPAPDVAHVAHISGFLFGVLCACVARGLDYLRNSPALVAH